MSHFLRRGWKLSDVTQHTYYQLKYIHQADIKDQKRQHFMQAYGCRIASTTDKSQWDKFAKDMQ